MDKLVIGVDIGGTRTKWGLVNIYSGEVLHSIVCPTEKTIAVDFLQQVGEVVKQLTSVAVTLGHTISGIGFGVPGYTGESGEVVTTYGFLEFMENYPLKTIIEAAFLLPCKVDNDARVVALGEALYGQGKGYNRVLTLTLGTGVGVGFVVNGAFIDALPVAHMGGHIKITDGAIKCYCGKTGCLEALVATGGIEQLARQWMGYPCSVKEVFDAAGNDDPLAIEVVAQLLKYLHTGIHNYVNLLAPDMIVLGGGIARGLSPYVDMIRGSSYLSPYPGYHFTLAVSTLHELAGMLGSAALFSNGLTKNTTHAIK